MKTHFWPRLQFAQVVVAVLIARILLALLMPLFGDEAYHLFWGQNPSFGYYDHPPMVGWVTSSIYHIRNVLGLGSGIEPIHPFFFRIPALIIPFIVAALISRVILFQKSDKESNHRFAKLMGLIYLLMPIPFFLVMNTLEAPLVLFIFSGTVLYWLSISNPNRRKRYALISGILFGLAFLSKFFAGLTVLSIFLFEFGLNRDEKFRDKLPRLAIACIGFAFLASINILWNVDHCMVNLKFHLFNRHGSETSDPISIQKILFFFVSQIYLLTPFLVIPLIQMFFQPPLADGQVQKNSTAVRFFAITGLFPIALFGISAFKFSQGLHWTMAFFPSLIVAIGLVIPTHSVARMARQMGVFAFCQLALVLVVLVLPTSSFKPWSKFSLLVLVKERDSILKKIEELRPSDAILTTDSYSTASAFGHALGRHIPLLFNRGRFGRTDDIVTNWLDYQGRHIAFVSLSAEMINEFVPYCASVSPILFEQSGVPFLLFDCRSFDAKLYIKNEKLPEIEHFWGLASEGCSVADRYSH